MENQDDKIEIIKRPDGGQGPVVPYVPQCDPLAIAEARNHTIARLKEYGLKQTTNADWTDFGGNPFLEASGAEKIARALAISFIEPRIEREDFNDNKGQYYVYTCYGRAKLPGNYDIVDAIGTCSSRDDFFGKAKDKTWKDISDIDVTDIKKKAYTNCLGNAIRKLVGLNGLTWPELAKYQITTSGKSSVDFKKGEKTNATGASSNPPEGGGPFYRSKDGKWLKAKLGRHFSAEILTQLGMKVSQYDTSEYYAAFNPQLMAKLAQVAADANLDQRPQGEEVSSGS